MDLRPGRRKGFDETDADGHGQRPNRQPPGAQLGWNKIIGAGAGSPLRVPISISGF
jgi:hypothetical protein